MGTNAKILLGVFLFSAAVFADEPKKGIRDRLWEKQVAAAVETAMGKKACKGADEKELTGLAIGDASKAKDFAEKTDLNGCLHVIYDQLHGKGGICKEDQSGYGVNYDEQCKKSDSAIRESFKQVNKGMMPQQGPVNPNDPNLYGADGSGIGKK